MSISPERIYREFRQDKLDLSSALSQLVSLVENVEAEGIRKRSLKYLEKIGHKNDEIFKLLENLLISDSSNVIRKIACRAIVTLFDKKALPIMKWTILHETDYDCSIEIIESLLKINNIIAKTILTKQIEHIIKNKLILENKSFTNKSFRKDYLTLLRTREITDFSIQELADLLINYKTILALKEKFYSVYYELENALVVTLDLTDIEYEVRGWKAEFKNNVHALSEITGLRYLKNLKTLYLANNQIQDLKELVYLQNLTKLYLSNNRIDHIKNLDYLKQLKNLSYVDLSDNTIARKISEGAIGTSTRLKLVRYNY